MRMKRTFALTLETHMEITHSFAPDRPWYNLSTGYAKDSNEQIAEASYLDCPFEKVCGPADILISSKSKEFIVRLFCNYTRDKIQVQGSYTISDQEHILTKRQTIDLSNSISLLPRELSDIIFGYCDAFELPNVLLITLHKIANVMNVFFKFTSSSFQIAYANRWHVLREEAQKTLSTQFPLQIRFQKYWRVIPGEEIIYSEPYTSEYVLRTTLIPRLFSLLIIAQAGNPIDYASEIASIIEPEIEVFRKNCLSSVSEG